VDAGRGQRDLDPAGARALRRRERARGRRRAFTRKTTAAPVAGKLVALSPPLMTEMKDSAYFISGPAKFEKGTLTMSLGFKIVGDQPKLSSFQLALPKNLQPTPDDTDGENLARRALEATLASKFDAVYPTPGPHKKSDLLTVFRPFALARAVAWSTSHATKSLSPSGASPAVLSPAILMRALTLLAIRNVSLAVGRVAVALATFLACSCSPSFLTAMESADRQHGDSLLRYFATSRTRWCSAACAELLSHFGMSESRNFFNVEPAIFAAMSSLKTNTGA
jgi:hypothetical protein